MTKYKTDRDCQALGEVNECLAKEVGSECGGNALSLTYNAMSEVF
jgi:hypothetical protein